MQVNKANDELQPHGMCALGFLFQDLVSEQGRDSRSLLRSRSFSWEDVQNAGPPAHALNFPNPLVHTVCKARADVLDTQASKIHRALDVLIDETNHRAFYIKRKAVSNGETQVKAVVLKPRNGALVSKATWETTNQVLSVKTAPLKNAKQLTCLLQEIAALQLSGDYNTYVQQCSFAFKDEDTLFAAFPFATKTLLQAVTEHHEATSWKREEQARFWFRDIIEGLRHLNRKGMCHMNLSLDKLQVDRDGRIVITDFSHTLRVPYSDSSSPLDVVTDVSSGSCHRLIKSAGLNLPAKSLFSAPEIVRGESSFDGFAVDLWSAGVILFVLLVGRAPFRVAHESDSLYVKITGGKLRSLLRSLNISLSDDACNLLKSMLRANPDQRLSLDEVIEHPWLTNAQRPIAETLDQLIDVYSTNRKLTKGSLLGSISEGIQQKQ